MNQKYPKHVHGQLKLDVNAFLKELEDALTGSEPESSDDFRNRYLLKSVASKYSFESIATPDERRDAALQSLRESEAKLAVINQNGFPFSVKCILHLASRHIAEVIGVEPDMKLFERSRHSDGASLDHKYGSSTSYHKYSSQVHSSVTPSALPYAVAILGNTPQWCATIGARKFKVVIHNKVATVPKNSTTDRPIFVEPPMNMYLQLAVGTFLKSRLKRYGIDLFDQSRNQNLALQASCYAYMESFGPVPDWWDHRGLCTIDLRNASNSLSWRLVYELLPEKWFDLLNALRCKVGWMGDRYHRMEMFSSMGNGFTFELESLIFWAIARACQDVCNLRDTPLGVFGDDIIVDRRCAAVLIAALNDVGFETNLEKTFLEGPFYESCGKHYHYGLDVTPFYIREPVDSVYRWIWFLNKLRVWSHCERLDCCDPRLYPIWKKYYRSLPWDLRGGLCDIMADDMVYQYNTQRKLAQRAVAVRKSKSFYGPGALLAYWQSVVPEVDTVEKQKIPWESYTRAGKRSLLSQYSREGELSSGFRLTQETAWFKVKPHQWTSVVNFQQLLSYGFPQELG